MVRDHQRRACGSRLLAPLAAAAALLFAAQTNAQGMFPAEPGPVAQDYLAKEDAPLAKLTPVTDETLKNPPPGEWLMWRRTYDGWGYSPLDQINKDNVKGLQLAWSWSMTNGGTEATPLVHDGVLFVQNAGDSVDALNAVTGDLLWRYERKAPKASMFNFKRMIAIYEDKILLATSEQSLVALDMKTGKPVWEKKVEGEGIYTSGPMVANGVVMIGATSCNTWRCYITGHDPKDGAELWRFYTVAAPGEKGGDTWNDMPADARYGGSSWTSGSYDPKSGLVYWGVGQPYPWNAISRGSSPLKKGKKNDLLYTNNTLALNPKTGKLIWNYSHLPNDNWDMDYVFERQLIDLPVKGKLRKVSVTAGKMAIVEGLDAKTGKFLFAHDLGLQNIVKSIDPKTGKKTINPDVVPTESNTVFMCPHPGGARSLGSTAYDPKRKILYMPLQEHCADMTSKPKEPDEKLTFPSFVLKLRPDSDGKVGRLEALNLETGKPGWIHRERAPMSSAALPTAGGVVFQGTYDRYFKAFDSDTGEVLWQTRLNDVPNSYPITFSVDGKQYVAVATGSGTPYTNTWNPLLPDVRRPPAGGAVMWVFRLPDAAAK